jgi:hypothetical protein
MKKLLFECPPDFNKMGVCHASSGAWLRYSRTRAASGGVKTLADLGQPSFFKLIWDDPDDAKGIDRLNLLGKPIDVVKKDGAFMPTDVAAALVRRLGEYCLISIWGDKDAHTVAAITIEENLQFFDPNVGCWTFDNTGELKDHVEERLSINDYADLFSKKYIIRRFK